MLKQNEKRQNYHHGNLHNTLLIEAAQIIKEQGLDALSIRKLAKKCNVSATALYRHFADKNDLLVEIINRGYELLYQHLNAILAKDYPDIVAKLKALGNGYIEFAQQQQNFFYIMYANNLLPEKYNSKINKMSNQVYKLLAEQITQGIKDNIFINDNPNYLTFSMWAYLHGITLLILQGKTKDMLAQSNMSIENFVNHLMDYLHTGIKLQNQGKNHD